MLKTVGHVIGAVAAIGILVSQTSMAAPIGEATETKNEVTGQLGGASARQISVGTEVSTDETVRTGASSAAVLRFLDNSDLNIGAVSTVVLDRFVYDPNSGSQDAVFNLTKGAMRFVSGGRRTQGAIINTPVGIIGIRGTDVLIACETGPVCAAAMASGRVRVCPVPTGTVVQQQLINACLQGRNEELPCDYFEIAAEGEQQNGEGSFTIVEDNCVFAPPTNLDAAFFEWLAEQLASGAPLPDPFQFTTLALDYTPGVNTGLAAVGIGALIAVPIAIIANNEDPVSP